MLMVTATPYRRNDDSSAGMPGPELLDGQDCCTLQLAGVPAGLFPGVSYDQFSPQLQPVDSVPFCSNGLTEARDADNQEFGLAGILEVCRRHREDSPRDLH
jgi:serine phosphatase RsbU (regulator of sigma subunit)